MNGLSAAAPSASSGPEIQELRTRLPSEVYLVLCLECHFAGIVPPLPGSALRGAVPPKSLGAQGDSAQLLGTALWREPVLVSAGTELSFFLVAGTVLCFGFSVRMMLITL